MQSMDINNRENNADIEEKINADKLLKWCFLYTLENFLNSNKKCNDNINDIIETQETKSTKETSNTDNRDSVIF